jgi:membrane associated rhomboid family serine protease
MTPTSVGMRCPECARQRTRVHRMRPGLTDVPVLTQAIIVVNVLVFIAELAGGGRFGSVGGSVYEKGVLFGPAIGIDHDYWRLVSSGFLHASFLHILFNMIFIWFIGRVLEPAIGSARLLAAYLTALLCGSLGVLLLEPNSFAVGASGAAFGLLGTLLIEVRSRGIDLWSTGLPQMALINFAFTFFYPGIAIGAHVGGFAGGLLVGVLFVQADQRRLPRWISLAGCVALAALAVIASIAVA